MNEKLTTKIKGLVIIALASDDQLMKSLTLKGGNALMMFHGLGSRGSYDLDYSLEGDFQEDFDIKTKIETTLIQTFKEAGYVIFDFDFKEIPKNAGDESRAFWGGYVANFKVIEREKYNASLPKDKPQKAIPVNLNSSPTFSIEISKFEYVGGRVTHEFDDYTVYVYALEMIVLEKVRAICQQLLEYREFLGSHEGSGRAKDFYDIHTIFQHCKIEDIPPTFKETLPRIFDAKKVPIEYLKQIRGQREFHRESFKGLLKTIKPVEKSVVEERGFDFYFDFVLSKFENIMD